MNENGNGLRDALTQIAEVARTALSGVMYGEGEYGDGHMPGDAPPQEIMTCTPKMLPKRLLVKAGEVAARINPVNAPAFGPVAEVAADLQLEPLRIAVMTAKYW